MFPPIQLESFVAVAEELHLGAAAGRLNMAQPPPGRQIQLLERELQAQAFVRWLNQDCTPAWALAVLADLGRVGLGRV